MFMIYLSCCLDARDPQCPDQIEIACCRGVDGVRMTCIRTKRVAQIRVFRHSTHRLGERERIVRRNGEAIDLMFNHFGHSTDIAAYDGTVLSLRFLNDKRSVFHQIDGMMAQSTVWISWAMSSRR